MKETGAWEKSDVAGQHVFSLNVGRWIGNFLSAEYPITDMGCGLGDYLWLWWKMGFNNLTGIEGSELGELFEYSNIIIHDLTEPIEMQHKGHVVALEIGEHIPSQYQDVFLDNITNNVLQGCYLVLSWAIPGQAGYGHCNNLPNETVIKEIESRGFTFLPRETISARDVVEHTCSWFRDTIMIFQKNEP